MSPPPFQRFYEEHRRDVLRFLTAATGPVDAQDCFQETFLSALRAYPRLRDDDNLRAWILTIASRKAVDAHRARARRPVPVPEVPEQPGHEPSEPGLWDAVRSLPPKQANALALRYACGLAHRDIAGVLACSEDAARQNVRAGLQKLREVWPR